CRSLQMRVLPDGRQACGRAGSASYARVRQAARTSALYQGLCGPDRGYSREPRLAFSPQVIGDRVGRSLPPRLDERALEGDRLGRVYAAVQRRQLALCAASSNRSSEFSTYAGSSSKLSHCARSPSATDPVVLLPANGSTTTSSSVDKRRIKNSGRAAGKRAGCTFFPISAHRRM